MSCEIYMIQHNYESKYLVVIINSIVYVYKNKICKFDPPLFTFQTRYIFIGK